MSVRLGAYVCDGDDDVQFVRVEDIERSGSGTKRTAHARRRELRVEGQPGRAALF